jgi:hypothetical protein
LAGISSRQTKFCYVISQLDHRYASEVEDIIFSPPEQDPYTMLRTELVRRLSPSKEQRIPQFLTLEMGNRKRSQFLRHLRSLAPDAPDDFLRCIWSSRLPSNVRAILAGQPEGDLNAAAHYASSRPYPSRRSRALRHFTRATHFRSGSRTSPARWQHSASSWPTFVPIPRVLAAHSAYPSPVMTLHPPFDGIIAATEPRRKSVLSLATTVNKKN